jgi:tRNA(Ile)-lysidine synthase
VFQATGAKGFLSPLVRPPPPLGTCQSLYPIGFEEPLLSAETNGTHQIPGDDHPGPDLIERVERFITANRLIPSGSRILVAVSGGQDSMAMLSILHRLSGRLELELAVGHFDHRLRPSSGADRAQVETFVKSLGLVCHSGSADVRSRSESGGINLEAAARQARYTFLYDAAGVIQADFIATGHTSSDQIETVLFHIIRGTGLRGLAGIPLRRDILIRPLMGINRQDTSRYCHQLALPVCEDATNHDTRLTRNRIRLELLPVIKDIHPEAEDGLLRLAGHAAKLLEWIRGRTQPLLDGHLRQTGQHDWLLDIAGWEPMDDITLVVLFGDLLSERMGQDLDLTQIHFESLLGLYRKKDASGKRLSLPGLEVIREYDSLLFSAHQATSTAPAILAEVEMPVPGVVTAGGRTFRAALISPLADADGGFILDPQAAHLAYDSLEPPLTIRSPRPGDRIRPFGLGGSKKLSDIFIDKKIPGRLRKEALVVADRSDIVWLVGLVTSEKGRIGRHTHKILKIEVDPE